jgi:hypothetical protein
MNKSQVEKVLTKLLPNILPEHVTDVAFDVHHTAPNEFTLYAVFAVPDDYWDSLDFIQRASLLYKTNLKLRHTIKSYTNIKVVFDPDNTRMINQSQFDK